MPIKYITFIALIFAFLLFTFNIYYFFIRRDVGITFYSNKVFHKAKDSVLLTPEYQDLVDEYYYLNQALGNKPVIVFLGDSLTKQAKVQEYFSDHFVLNRGIDSDTTVSLLNRLDRNVGNLKIDKLFLLIGHNDLQYRTNSEIVANIKTVLERIKARKIYLQSLIPTNAKKKEINFRRNEINELLKNLCSETGAEFVDLHKHFLDEAGGLSTKYSIDGAHLNGAGYQLWRGLIAPKLLEEPTRDGPLNRAK